jgi:predicted ATP-grasp superfamily ATP-dependent carboligase
MPATWFPTTDAEVADLAPKLSYPVLVKPRTQVYLTSHIKGLRVHDPDQLKDAWQAWTRQQYAPKLLAYDPTARLPMIQAYHPESSDQIYSLCGVVDGGRIAGVRAAHKLLQIPRHLGIGICFEEAPVDPMQVAAVGRLLDAAGYFGVFEFEFIRVGERTLLIDANPRFYSQMGFDIDRGMPLPLYVYAAALGEARPEMNAPEAAPRRRVYIHRLNLELTLWLQSLSGRVAPAERERWQRWCEERLPAATDAVIDPDDLLPAAADLVRTLGAYARHPRSFVRTLVFDRQ